MGHDDVGKAKRISEATASGNAEYNRVGLMPRVVDNRAISAVAATWERALESEHDGRLREQTRADEAEQHADNIAARLKRAEALNRWLAHTVILQQDAFAEDDCPESAKEYIMMSIPRVQGLSNNMALIRIGERWDKARDSDLVREALASLDSEPTINVSETDGSVTGFGPTDKVTCSLCPWTGIADDAWTPEFGGLCPKCATPIGEQGP